MLSKFSKILLLMALLLCLNGCLGDQSWCITTSPDSYLSGDSIKNTSITPFTIAANGTDPSNPSLRQGGWIRTGIGVVQGENITISANGSMLLTTPYGLASGSTGSMNQSYLLAVVNQSDTSSYFDNNGLGTKMVIKASNNSPTLIADPKTGAEYKFVAGQNVYVTTKDCATGDANSSEPTKWTWKKWNTQAVRCTTRGTRNFTVNSPYCKAITCCRSDSVTCFDTDQWQCSYVTLSSSSNMVDVCGSSQNNYNCEANSSQSGTCYNTTGYEAINGWCGGRRTSKNISMSNDHPSCGSSSSTQNQTTPVLNSCGTSDTCWNIAGYRMYAFNANATCPGSNSCVHLNNSAFLTGGKVFQAQGGAMYLKIIYPSSGSGSDTDVTSLQTQVTTNDQTIAGLVVTNENLTNSLYQVSGQTVLSSGSVATTNGLLINISNYNSSASIYTPISTLQAEAYSYQGGNTDAAAIMQNINTQFSSLIDNYVTFNGFMNSGAAADNANDIWNTVTLMNNNVSTLSSLVNSLSTSGTTANTVPTTNQVTSYKSKASQMLTALSSDINSAISTNTTIKTNESQIDSLSTQNNNLNSQIISTSNQGPNGAVGGYTTYVRSDPIVAQNGQYMQVIVSSVDPNYNNLSATDLGQISSAPKTVNITQTGELWAAIFDPDQSYSENIGSYTVNIGKTTTASGFGNIFTSIINQIITKVDGLTKRMYEGMTCSASSDNSSCTDYITLLHITLLLYVIIYGIMFLFGLIQESTYGLMMRIIKISVIAALVRPSSFDFFNDTVFKGFLSLTNTLLSAAVGAPLDNPFAFLEQSIALLILDPNTYLKIISLMFIGLLGIVAFVLLLYGIFKFVSAIFHAMNTYVMAYVGLAICFVLAPIYIPFALFRRTAHLFESWYIAMFRFAIEPVLLLVGLVLFNAMLLNILQQLFNFSACFKCLIPIKFAIPGVPSVPSTTLFCIPGFAPWGVDNLGSGVAFQFFFSIPLAITFCIITKVMDIYAKTFAKQISSHIFGGGTSFLRNERAELGMNPFKDIADTYSKMKSSFAANMGAGGGRKNAR